MADLRFSRCEAMLGEQNMKRLEHARVLLFGIGGVGGYAAEAFVRSGIGTIGLVDNDTVDLTNLNRQIIATDKTLGKNKTEVMKDRILSINPNCRVMTYNMFYLPETDMDFENYDYVIDAVDTVTAKIDIIEKCKEKGIPIISCMGTGNKTDITKLQVSDIEKTAFCPLARVMRKELKARNIRKVKVVYSTEEPVSAVADNTGKKRHAPGSMIMVPAAAGLLLANTVIQDLISD